MVHAGCEPPGSSSPIVRKQMSENDFTKLDLGPLRAMAEIAEFMSSLVTGHSDQDQEARQ
jgi:hypothetical protein